MANSCLIDNHVHSDNSPDGNHSCMFICENAVAKGLRAIAITDHCETDTYYQEHYDRSSMQSFFEISKAKTAYTGKLLVLKGIELGQAAYNKELAEKIITKQNYDVIIGSIHNLRNTEDFYFMKSFTEETAFTYMTEYVNELKILADWGKFDILAHITYPLRYFYSKSNISFDMNILKKDTDELLSLLAEKELALEINTGGLRQPLNKLSPDIDLIKRFKELGGKYITLGSDAHYAEDLASDFDKAVEAAKQAGFEYCVFYQNHHPMEVLFE